MSSSLVVPFHRPSVGEEEIAAIADTLRSGWLTTGPRVAEFETAFCAYTEARFAVAVNSCTAGLHLALAALRIGEGDEVITTPLTFCSTVNVILHARATPVLADVGADGNINPQRIAECITRRTKAILPVHLAGLPCDMRAIRELAGRHGIAVVEDCAHAVGAQVDGQRIGSFPPDQAGRKGMAAFSFYATKNMTTGEGGMVTTADQEAAERVRLLSLHGISKGAWNRYADRGHWYYEVLEPGFKYNMMDIQAAIGIHQLRKLERFLELRARYAHLYGELLRGVEEVELPPTKLDCRHAWHLYMLRLHLDRLTISREQFIEQLRERGVGTSVHFIPIPLHPYYAGFPGEARGSCPAALSLYPRLVSLPLYPAMTEAQVEYVAHAVRAVVRASRRQTRVSVAACAAT
ncbi:MAG: DegT/DnrJ/EryC1/StrS aminotransferase family protein [Acidobacteria bacterium]|nr:DegT/DnrJ/EryC1/StrS aminotransferase family protein [Acidobacteriota bacterium]